jgi:hypothetical protein
MHVDKIACGRREAAAGIGDFKILRCKMKRGKDSLRDFFAAQL